MSLAFDKNVKIDRDIHLALSKSALGEVFFFIHGPTQRWIGADKRRNKNYAKGFILKVIFS